MAIVEVKVPELSESVAEATLLAWKKQPGQAVELDEILIEIETDKVVLEVPAPAAGVLAKLVKNDGEQCVALEVIATIDTEGVASSAAAPAAAAHSAAAPLPAPAAPAASGAAAGAKSGVAMPAAAKLMADNKLDAGSVADTGKDGRVTKGDVLGAIASGAKAAPSAPAAPAPARASQPRRLRQFPRGRRWPPGLPRE